MTRNGAHHYQPKPIDTSRVKLPPELRGLPRRLAEHNHDVWARERMRQGWQWGRVRDDAKKTHPDLVPYRDLPRAEKVFDVNSVRETLKAAIALGHRITRIRRP